MQDEKSSLTLVFEAQLTKFGPLEDENRKYTVAILLKLYSYNFITLFTDFGETGSFLVSFSPADLWLLCLGISCVRKAFFGGAGLLRWSLCVLRGEKKCTHAFLSLWRKYLDVCCLFLIWHQDIRARRMLWVNDVIGKRLKKKKKNGKW